MNTNKKIGLRDVLRNYWNIAKEYKYKIILYWSLVIISAFTEIISPIYVKKFFDVLTQPISRQVIYNQAYVVLMVVISIILVRFLLRRITSYLHRKMFNSIEFSLYFDAYNRILNHAHNFFVSNSAGTLAHKIDKYRNSFGTLWKNFSNDILPNLVRSIGFTIVLFYFNKTIGLIMTVWFVIFISTNYWYSQYVRENRKEISKLKSKINGDYVDSFSNHLTVQLFTGFSKEKNNAWSKISRLIGLYKIRTTRDDKFFMFQSLITTTVEVLIFVFGLYYFKLGLVTVGFFYLAYTYIKKLSEDMWSISGIFKDMSEAYVDAVDIVEIMEAPFEITDTQNPVEIKKTKGEINFDGITYEYNKGDTQNLVLDNLSLEISKGQKIALIGQSGAGKTTLVKLLFRLFDVQKGSINIDGNDIRNLRQEDLHKIIGFVPQESVLFHRSIRENINYGRHDATEEEIIKAAKKAHAHEFISKFPNGYNTLVGERGVKLSGGERQRIAIARAILKNAPILVLDEATSALDSETEIKIQEALQELMKGKTVIAIAHRLSTIKMMDRILVLEKGKIIEDGGHDELLQNSGSIYKKLWDLQAGGFIKEENNEEEDI